MMIAVKQKPPGFKLKFWQWSLLAVLLPTVGLLFAGSGPWGFTGVMGGSLLWLCTTPWLENTDRQVGE